MGVNEFNSERLREAMLFREKTKTALAEEIGVSKQYIYKLEKGYKPSFETLINISKVLGFPRQYFFQKDTAEIQIYETFFRSSSTLTKRARDAQEERITFISKIYAVLNKYVNFPALNIPKIDVELSVEEQAKQLREYWNIGDEPIKNIIYLLESNGVIVATTKSQSGSIDGYSSQRLHNNTKYSIVVLEDDSKPFVRRQFSAAHELGHIINHHDMKYIFERDEEREIENTANDFASAFLLPKKAFLADLEYPKELSAYVNLKKKWNVSISAMIRRAKDLERISQNTYVSLNKRININNWRKIEPLDLEIPIKDPSSLRKSVELLLSEKIFTAKTLLQEFEENGLKLTVEMIEELLNLEEGTLQYQETENVLDLEIRFRN